MAVDNVAKRLRMLQHNASVYGVQADCVLCDAYRPPFRHNNNGHRPVADAVFMSPPWGGPKYSSQTTVAFPKARDLASQVLRVHMAPTVILFLPRNAEFEPLTYTTEDGSQITPAVLLELYTNRNSVLPSKGAERGVGQPQCPEDQAWMWRPTAVAMYTGAVAQQAVQQAATRHHSRRLLHLSAKRLMQIWRRLRRRITAVYGDSGRIPVTLEGIAHRARRRRVVTYQRRSTFSKHVQPRDVQLLRRVWRRLKSVQLNAHAYRAVGGVVWRSMLRRFVKRVWEIRHIPTAAIQSVPRSFMIRSMLQHGSVIDLDKEAQLDFAKLCLLGDALQRT